MIDDIETWNPLRPIDRCDRFQKRIVEFLLEIRAYFDQIFWLQHNRLLLMELKGFYNSLREHMSHRLTVDAAVMTILISIPSMCKNTSMPTT